MNVDVVLHEQTEIKRMQDGSGIVLYSDFSGQSAFLANADWNADTNQDSLISNSDMTQKYTEFDVHTMLNLPLEETQKIERWLLDNHFLIKITH
jgi:hypothetical protein